MNYSYFNTAEKRCDSISRTERNRKAFNSKASTTSSKIFSRSTGTDPGQRREAVKSLQQQASCTTVSTPQVSIVPIPGDVAIVQGERWWIQVEQFDICWRYPLQWRRDELQMVRWLIDRIDWTIDTNEGCPVHISSIHKIVECRIEFQELAQPP